MKARLRYIALLLLILFIAGISLANMESVTVSYLLGTFQLPLIILILLSALIGSIITLLLGFNKQLSVKNELKQVRKELDQQTAKTKQDTP